MQPEPSKTAAKTLLEAFTELPDPRVIQRCDHLLHEVPRAFGECFARWTQGVRERLRGGAPADGEIVALDGRGGGGE